LSGWSVVRVLYRKIVIGSCRAVVYIVVPMSSVAGGWKKIKKI
jgi:hypothetical protein